MDFLARARTAASARVATLCGAAILIAAPIALAAPAEAATSTEHGVNRQKLAAQAEQIVETRNGIEVLKISRCSPQKRKGKVDFSVWSCFWRAEGQYKGQVPYHCAGKAKWKRKKRRWLVDGCANILQPQAPLLDLPNPHPTYGLNDDWANHLFMRTPAHADAILDLLDDTHSGVIRMNLLWSVVEARRGSYDWSAFDQLNRIFTDHGLRPLWVVLVAPCWAQPNPAGCANGSDKLRPAPAYYDEMAKFAAAAAVRYPNAAGLEIWNEPNYPRFWGGDWPDPGDYSAMLKKSADAIHAAAPQMPVISGGLSPHADSDNNAIGFSNFLAAMYRNGAAQAADAIGVHPYAGVGPDEDYVADVRVYLGKIQREMRAAGDVATPMWATEFGISTTGPHAYSREQQGTALVEIYEVMRRIETIPLVILNGLVDNPGLAEREGGWGIADPDLSKKPSFCAINTARGVPC